MLGHYLTIFAHDTKVQIVLLLLIADLLLGVIAAINTHTFRLSLIADVLRNDVLGKILPWFVLYAADAASTSAGIIIPGLDWGVLADGAFALILAALVGSIFSSLQDLGLMRGAAPEIAGPENSPPQPRQ